MCQPKILCQQHPSPEFHPFLCEILGMVCCSACCMCTCLAVMLDWSWLKTWPRQLLCFAWKGFAAGRCQTFQWKSIIHRSSFYGVSFIFFPSFLLLWHIFPWSSPIPWSHMEVSTNGGTPKSSISRWYVHVFSTINQPFGGTPILGNPHLTPLASFSHNEWLFFPGTGA